MQKGWPLLTLLLYYSLNLLAALPGIYTLCYKHREAVRNPSFENADNRRFFTFFNCSLKVYNPVVSIQTVALKKDRGSERTGCPSRTE